MGYGLRFRVHGSSWRLRLRVALSVWGSGFRPQGVKNRLRPQGSGRVEVEDSRVRAKTCGPRSQGSGIRIRVSVFKIKRVGLTALGTRFKDSGVRFMDWGVGL